MSTSSNRLSVYDSVTNNIISKLEQGITPWIKPWSVSGATGADRNVISKKEYSGVNRLILGMSGYSSPIWGSFKQWQNSVKGSDKDAMKSNIIVSFLAMLELVRQGMMDALQNADFEDIELLSVEKEHDTITTDTANNE